MLPSDRHTYVEQPPSSVTKQSPTNQTAIISTQKRYDDAVRILSDLPPVENDTLTCHLLLHRLEGALTLD